MTRSWCCPWPTINRFERLAVTVGALDRRLAAREAHIARGDEPIEAGNVLCGVALLDERDRMVGSVMIVDFPDRQAVDAWLQTEAYVIGGVWQAIDVRPCRVGPSFVGLHETPARS